MGELEILVIRAMRGDWEAYEPIVQRFQDMAVGYGYAMLGDMALAEEAAQEAFINAYRDLDSLRDPAAFPGWFRQIVFKHVDRTLRSQRKPVLSLEELREMSSRLPGPDELAERHDIQTRIFEAIKALPEHQRSVVTLFYIHSYSQDEISSFLEIPVATVKTRLHAARKRLKERMLAVIQDQLPNQRPSRDDTFTQKVMGLFHATIADDVTQVKALLKENPSLAIASGKLDSPLWNADTPALHVAVMYGRKDIVDLLLANGADINETDKKWRFSALHQAIDLEFLPDYAALGMVDFLISRGARKDIFAMLWVEDVEGVNALLEENPTLVNAVGPNQATPICHASGEAMMELLLEHGADLFVHQEGGWGSSTPLRWIAQHNRKAPQKLKFLLKRAGVPKDIFLACVLGETDQVTTLLAKHPALIQATTGENHVLEPGLTTLHLAAQFGHTEITRILLERGADVNAKSALSHYLTPLHVAVWRGQIVQNPTQPISDLEGYHIFRLLPDISRLLLEHGADVHARDSLQKLTPLGWAEANLEEETDRSEVVELLRQYGARK